MCFLMCRWPYFFVPEVYYNLLYCMQFMDFAKLVCEWLMGNGYWADYIDPCSGLPMIHKQGNNVYGEVQGLVTLLGYQIQNAGCCKIILHPVWGSSVYPASFFTKAPLEMLQKAIKTAEESLTVK